MGHKELNKVNTVLFDIETTPLLSWNWGKYDQNAIAIKEHSHLLSFSAKKLGGKQITKGLIDYKGYRKDLNDDFRLTSEIWAIFNEADIIIAHNGRAFDTKKVNARFSFHHLPPPSPYKVVDTKEMAKRSFNFTSNSLNDIADYLGIGRKLETGGFELWKECMAGNGRAWREMKTYNAYDVILLEKVYLRLLPFMQSHPNLSSIVEGLVCPKCGSGNLQSRGEARTISQVYGRFQCLNCGGWGRYPKKERSIKITRSI